jgi:hypothetical protein
MTSFTTLNIYDEMLLVNRHLFGQSHCSIELVLLWIDTIASLVSAGVNPMGRLRVGILGNTGKMVTMPQYHRCSSLGRKLGATSKSAPVRSVSLRLGI